MPHDVGDAADKAMGLGAMTWCAALPTPLRPPLACTHRAPPHIGDVALVRVHLYAEAEVGDLARGAVLFIHVALQQHVVGVLRGTQGVARGSTREDGQLAAAGTP